MLHLYEAVNAVYGHWVNENWLYNNPFTGRKYIIISCKDKIVNNILADNYLNMKNRFNPVQ